LETTKTQQAKQDQKLDFFADPPVGYKTEQNNQNLDSFAANRMGNMSLAAADPVEDYRVLAQCDFWTEVIGSKKELSCMDVCAGTGRWMQSFSELVLEPRAVTAKVDCVDLCATSLQHLESRLPQMPGILSGQTHNISAATLQSFDGQYDVVTNMHGLYGVPLGILSEVVSSMVNAVKPGGYCVLALGDNRSFYVRYPQALQKLGVMEEGCTSANDVESALIEQGIDFQKLEVNYIQQTKTEEQLIHYVMNESGGNIWPADDNRTGRALDSFVAQRSGPLGQLIDAHAVGSEHHFPQSVPVLLIRKPDAK
jgi:2-polyprenyl-3-methyl-5-hydroxy-6-metoxy-1,4-benzoquinol methylase